MKKLKFFPILFFLFSYFNAFSQKIEITEASLLGTWSWPDYKCKEFTSIMILEPNGQLFFIGSNGGGKFTWKLKKNHVLVLNLYRRKMKIKLQGFSTKKTKKNKVEKVDTLLYGKIKRPFFSTIKIIYTKREKLAPKPPKSKDI
jgi:hypothetical protein